MITNNKIEEAIEVALSKYDKDNIDIIKNEETYMIDIIYHSNNNSFPIVSSICSSKYLSEEGIKKLAAYYGVGYCW